VWGDRIVFDFFGSVKRKV